MGRPPNPFTSFGYVPYDLIQRGNVLYFFRQRQEI